MNKAQLIDALSARFEGNKRAAAHALESVLDTITRQVASGEKVGITGFGTFEKINRPARMVRNPRTGERKRAKKTSVAKFRPGAELKAVVAGEKKLPKLATAKKTAAKSTTSKSTASKSTATKAPARSAAKSTSAATSTTSKSAAKKASTRSTAAKTTSTGTAGTAKKSPTRSTAKKTTTAASATKTASTPTAKKSSARSTAKKTARKR